MITTSSRPSTAQVASHYDDLDPFYRKLWGEHVHHGLWERGDEDAERAVCALVDRVAEVARIAPGSDVCDVGCGYGATACRMTERYGARVVGLTISRAQAEYAQRAIQDPDAPRILCRDWLDSGLPSESFDAVVAIESLEHMLDKPRFFAEARRVLRPGGRLVVCSWLATERPTPWQRRELLERICVEGRLAELPESDECSRWFHDGGFVDVTFEDLTAKVQRTWTLCAARVARAVAFDRTARSFLFRGSSEHRIFALTVLRILSAYRLGAMKYGLFDAIKP
ncbi:MAG TPA: class I SAM-dependent methyltransferase [Polyangiaceae bacterium]|nr:class I SAM-dependent methyltransferase [Polyangiaceae bacterium]